MYYSANSVLNASTSVGTYTGNGTQTRTINVSNGKFLILCCPSSPGRTNWGFPILIFVQYGATYTFSYGVDTIYYHATFNNNTISIENEQNFTYMNDSNQLYLWAIFT